MLQNYASGIFKRPTHKLGLSGSFVKPLTNCMDFTKTSFVNRSKVPHKIIPLSWRKGVDLPTIVRYTEVKMVNAKGAQMKTKEGKPQAHTPETSYRPAKNTDAFVEIINAESGEVVGTLSNVEDAKLLRAAPELLEVAMSIRAFWDTKIKAGSAPRLTITQIAKLCAAIQKAGA